MDLALFDLDHTLIPFDSGLALRRASWSERGALDAGFEEEYLAYCRRYVEGTLDIAQMHRYSVGALARHPREALARWLADFEATLAAARARRPRAIWCDGTGRPDDLCALVTATTRFIAEPFARVLGLDELLATEPAVRRAAAATPARSSARRAFASTRSNTSRRGWRGTAWPGNGSSAAGSTPTPSTISRCWRP